MSIISYYSIFYTKAGEWWCSEKCKEWSQTALHSSKRTGNRKLDHVQEYHSAIAWRGLAYFCEVDSERENDGPAMIANWKLNMPQFWARNHYKYLILGHRMLTGRYVY